MSVMVAIADPKDDKVDVASSAPAAEPPGKMSLSTAQCKAARQAFLQHDADGNGLLDLEEFKGVMHAICPDMDEQQFVHAFNAIDVDGSGSIDYSEFMAGQEKLQAWSAFGFSLAAPEDLHVSSVAALAAWELPAAPMPVEPPRLFITDALCFWLAQKFPWLKPVSMLNGTMATSAEVCMRGAWPLRCADAILRGSSQVMMINNPIGGLLMLGALFVPSAPPAVAGLLGLLGATLCAFALRLDAHSRQAGLFGYNGVLVGLGLATFLDGAARWDAGIFIMAPILGALSVVLQLAIGNALVPTFKLPPATLAFNLINVLIIVGSQNFARFRVADFLAPKLGAPAGATNATLAAYGYMDEPTTVTMVWALHAALVSVGQVFLCQSATSGALILAGMAVSSRIAAIAAYAGALCGVAVALALGAPLGQIGAGLWGYNATLGAANVMIFFQPTLVACIFSLVSAFLCVLFDGLLKGACAPLGLPVGTTPFCLAALTFLLTHGKIPGLHPIPLAKVATPEDQLISTARTETLLKHA
jgi:urea transporter